MADAKAVVEQWLDAIESRNVERISDALADDVSLETEMLRQPIRGKRLIHDLLVGGMDAYESIRIEKRKIVASGRDVAALVEMNARFRDDIDMLGEKLPTKGKALEIMAALFAEVNDQDKIAKVMRVRDTLGVVRQLGLSADQVQSLERKLEEQFGAARRAA